MKVKQRDFMAKFGHYKNDEVEIIGRNDVVVGTYIPGRLPEGAKWMRVNEDVNKGDAIVNKKEIADKIVEEAGEKKKYFPVAPEIDCRYANAWMSKDSTDNAEGLGRIAKDLKENFPEDIIDVSDPVGTCDICHNLSKELWEHEEEGIERNVCRNCFAVRFDTLDKLEKFLSTKKRVQWTNEYELEKKGKLSITMRSPAKFSDFNPIPKPVKKEKK